MQITHFVLSLFVATALAPVSWADDDHEKSKPQLGADGGKHGGDDSKHGGDDNDKRDGAKHDMGHDGGAEADEDESKGEDKDEPAEHKGKRRGYIHKIKKELDEATTRLSRSRTTGTTRCASGVFVTSQKRTRTRPRWLAWTHCSPRSTRTRSARSWR
jgi:hypothetical protein